MPKIRLTTYAICGSLALIATATFMLPDTLTVPATVAADPPETLHLSGIVRDFLSSHPDFGIIDPTALGDTVGNVSATLPPSGRPTFIGPGVEVIERWYDKDGREIMPYNPLDSGEGLPGGHFDVDIFDAATDSELWHKHQYDDSYDVAHLDVAADVQLLFRDVIPLGYPNDLRLEFLNPHHSSGTFTFQAGGPEIVQSARDPFTATFDPDTLTKCRVDFTWLLQLRGTDPGDVQGDIADRDDAFAMRFFDVTTNELVYEMAAYHHGEEGSMDMPDSFSGEDSCGGDIDDSLGSYGATSSGGIANLASYGDWFRTVFDTNQSKRHDITLNRDLAGVYEYLTDEFYPVDGELLGNDGESHNNSFTYTFSASFTYEACAGLFLEFEGNDDCWVFINGELVMDLGGLGRAKQYLALDRLDLVDGQECQLDFFYAQRRPAPDSMFRLRTNIPLATTGILAVSGFFD